MKENVSGCFFLNTVYFDTVGWVFWPVKNRRPVLVETLNPAQSTPADNPSPCYFGQFALWIACCSVSTRHSFVSDELCTVTYRRSFYLFYRKYRMCYLSISAVLMFSTYFEIIFSLIALQLEKTSRPDTIHNWLERDRRWRHQDIQESHLKTMRNCISANAKFCLLPAKLMHTAIAL